MVERDETQYKIRTHGRGDNAVKYVQCSNASPYGGHMSYSGRATKEVRDSGRRKHENALWRPVCGECAKWYMDTTPGVSSFRKPVERPLNFDF
jgi:hypothetical protein